MENYLDLQNDKDYSKLKLPGKIINQGGIVVFPTETVYGIGTNGLNDLSIQKLYNVKNRPLNKPISLLVNNIAMVEHVAKNITKLDYALMEAFFPGPLTIILEKKSCVPNILTSNTNFVGVRIPNNEIALKLIEYANVPIATPSANISGKPSGINFDYVKSSFKNNVDFYINGR